jgi:hypothetical protein
MGGDPSCTQLAVTAVDELGKPLFGLDAELIARQVRFGQDDDAKVSIGGISSHSPETALIRIAAYQLAAAIAAAANAAARAHDVPQDTSLTPDHDRWSNFDPLAGR